MNEMNRINDTTRQSELNKLKRDIDAMKRSFMSLVMLVNKVVNYETKTPTPWLENSSVSNIINTLSENMDVMMDQMLKTQDKILDANTITISKKLSKDSVSVEGKGKSVELVLNVMPDESGKVVLNIDGVKLTLYANFKRKVCHTDNSKFSAKVCDNKIQVESTDEVHNVSIDLVDLIKKYEFEQDEFMSFCVEYISNNDERFFNELIQVVQEVKT